MHALNDRSIKASTAGTPESNSEHVRSSLARGLQEFSPAPCAHDGNFVIVGSGPSVTDFIEEIRIERSLGRSICAINGAHDLLVDNGIEPDLFVTCDPRIIPRFEKPSDRCCYLLASRCHPEMFEKVKGKKIILWHSFSSKLDAPVPQAGKDVLTWDDFMPEEECEPWRGRLGIGGGSTSGLRAIYLAYLMGFRKVILYGMDSCLAPDKKTKRFSGEDIGKGKLVDVIVGGKRFWCNGAMAKQASEFQPAISHFPDLSIEVKGNGLLAEIMKVRNQRA